MQIGFFYVYIEWMWLCVFALCRKRKQIQLFIVLHKTKQNKIANRKKIENDFFKQIITERKIYMQNSKIAKCA